MKGQKTLTRLMALMICLIMLLTVTSGLSVYADDTTSDNQTPTQESSSTTPPPASSSTTTPPPASSSSTTPPPASSSSNQEEGNKNAIKDLNGKMSDLQKQQDALNKQINSAKTEKDKQLAVKKQLDNKISISQQQINLLTKRMNLLAEDIATKEQEIAVLEAETDQTYEVYKSRLRAMYMSGNQTILGAVLGAESFGDFLTRAEVLRRVSKHDQTVLDLLKAQKEQLDQIKAELEEEKKQQEADKAQVESLKKELNGQLAQTNSKIQDISALEKEYLANKDKLKKEMDEVQSEINEIYKALGGSSGEYVGGRMGWPVPGYTYISSYYGWRFGGTDYHTGIDIAGGGINGKAIVASNSGTVVHVTLSYTPGRGYGKYLIIDHGGGRSTLYGHTSAINVSVGERVAKGERIASVGSTGWSTGPHLHFEIRENGKHTNPLPYLK